MQGDLKLVNINDERFWDILFDEACVEGQQATRIRNELEKIIAYDVEKVIEQIESEKEATYNRCIKGMYDAMFKDFIGIVSKGGKE